MLGKDEQLIISISREFGSGGKEIAGYLGEYFDIPVYEKNLLPGVGLKSAEDLEEMKEIDEHPRNFFGSRTVRGLTNSNEEYIAKKEFDLMRQMADEGKSFVILGHCSEEVLKDYPGLVTFFISASHPFKLDRIMAEHHVDLEEAKKMERQHNRKRKNYHNSHTPHKWGDSRYYEMCLHSDELGCRKTADFLIRYIQERFQLAKQPMVGTSISQIYNR